MRSTSMTQVVNSIDDIGQVVHRLEVDQEDLDAAWKNDFPL